MLIKHRVIIIFLAILILGGVLRANNLTTQPRLGATFDEFAWTWVGISLIQEHVPSSWSPHSQYEGFREYKRYLDADFWIVKPYLEHPPGFGIVAGSFALLNGAQGMFDVTLDKIRPLALILGILSIGMVFFLVKELYDESTALLASLIYATVPTIVLGSRLVQNENFFIPLYLLALFLIAKFIKSKNHNLRNGVALICGVLVVSKVPWIAASVGITAILLFKHKYKDSLKLLGVVAVFFIAYILYGLYFNSEIFINLWALQLERYDISFNSVYAIFTQPYLADRYFIDGWIYFGWFAFVLLLVKDFKKNFIVIFGLMAYLGIFIFAIPNEAGHGWYRYPFYPFLIISIALFVKEYFNKNTILTFLFLIFIGLALLETSYGAKYGFSFLVMRSFLFLLAFTLLPLFFKNSKMVFSVRWLNFIFLVLLFLLNILSIYQYTEA